MTTATQDIEPLLKYLERQSPGKGELLLDLAEAVSLAARVEPELLRAARLTLTPLLDASAEADLWFSPMVESGTADWLVLAQEWVEKLRNHFAETEDNSRLHKARELIKQAHQSAPPTIVLEEEIVWLALQLKDNAREPIGKKLRLVLDKLLENITAHRGLARWFASVAPRLPLQARDTEAYALLTFVASALLDGRFINELNLTDPGLVEELASLLPVSIPKETVWVSITNDGLIFRPDQAAGFAAVELPRTNPLVVRLHLPNGERQIVSLRRGKTETIRIKPGTVDIHTAAGETYRFTPHLSSREFYRTYGVFEFKLEKMQINRDFRTAPNDFLSARNPFSLQESAQKFDLRRFAGTRGYEVLPSEIGEPHHIR